MDPKRRARLILIAGFLLALSAGGGTYAYLSSAPGAAPAPPPTVEVVVAARELPARTALTAADVKVARINADAAPANAFKDPKEVVGGVLATGVSPNEPLLPSKIAAKDRAFTVLPPGQKLEANTPAYRVMAITVPDSFAVGGVLVPGDLVDIMYVYPFNPAARIEGAAAPAAAPGATPATSAGSPFTADTVAKIIVGPLEILARKDTLYTIRVEAKLAEELAYVQASGGTLQLLLRAPADERKVETTGATFDKVFPDFRLPVPKKVSP